MTVRQLLQHTSGIYNYTNDLPGLASAEAFQAARLQHYEPDDLVAIAMRHEPLFAPGTQLRVIDAYWEGNQFFVSMVEV